MTEPMTVAGRRLLVASEQATNLRHIRPVFADEVRAIEAEARKQASCLCSDPFPILPDGDCFRARHDAYCRANSPVRIAFMQQEIHNQEAEIARLRAALNKADERIEHLSLGCRAALSPKETP